MNKKHVAAGILVIALFSLSIQTAHASVFSDFFHKIFGGSSVTNKNLGAYAQGMTPPPAKNNPITPVLGLNLLVNGSANPSAVVYNSKVTIAWSATSAVKCSPYGSDLPIASLDTDVPAWANIPLVSPSASMSFLASNAINGDITKLELKNPLQIGLQCWDAKNNTVKKVVTLPIITPAPSACTINTFNDNPSNISSGNGSVLAWKTTNCSYVNVSAVGNNLATTSTMTVKPSTTTTYTLTAYPGGITAKTVVTLVTPPTITVPTPVTATAATPPVTVAACTSSTPPTVTVLSPNGGQTFKVDQQVTVTWSSCNLAKTSPMFLTIQGDAVVNGGKGINIGGFTNTGSYTFAMPDLTNWPGLIYGKHYMVRVGSDDHTISAPSAADNSDTTFTITQ